MNTTAPAFENDEVWGEGKWRMRLAAGGKAQAGKYYK